MFDYFVNCETGAISDLVKRSIKNPIKKYNIIYIDIWYDGHTMKSSFNGVEGCKHKQVDDDKRCDCGAWVGNIAEETEPWEYYQHIFNIVNNVYANEVYIRSPKYYPPEYKYHIFDTEVKLNFPYAETYHIFDKVVSFNEREQNLQQKSFYLSHFVKKKSKLWKSKVLTYKGFNPLFLLGSNSLYVNPYYNEVKSNIDIEYFICNTNVLETIKK